MFMEDNVFRKVLLKKEESIYIPQGERQEAALPVQCCTAVPSIMCVRSC
jgi:hypothetical protein